MNQILQDDIKPENTVENNSQTKQSAKKTQTSYLKETEGVNPPTRVLD